MAKATKLTVTVRPKEGLKETISLPDLVKEINAYSARINADKSLTISQHGYMTKAIVQIKTIITKLSIDRP